MNTCSEIDTVITVLGILSVGVVAVVSILLGIVYWLLDLRERDRRRSRGRA